jgi:hypothetical protein
MHSLSTQSQKRKERKVEAEESLKTVFGAIRRNYEEAKTMSKVNVNLTLEDIEEVLCEQCKKELNALFGRRVREAQKKAKPQ